MNISRQQDLEKIANILTCGERKCLVKDKCNPTSRRSHTAVFTIQIAIVTVVMHKTALLLLNVLLLLNMNAVLGFKKF